MTNIVILIVEDKDEETLAAHVAVKNHFGIPLDQEGAYLGLEIIKEKLGYPDWKADKTSDGIVSIMTAVNLNEAKKGLEKISGFSNIFPTVGVITDLMFPGGPGGSVQANGIEVMLIAIERKIPVVVCSDTDHHEVGFVPRLATVLAPLHPSGKIPVILDTKDWNKAVLELVALLFSERILRD